MLSVAAPASASTVQVVPGTFLLEGVACPSATTCVAVGYNSLPITSGGPSTPEGVVVPITKGVPGTPQMVPGTFILSGVACSSATTCEAVGSNGVVVPITNGTPGTAKTVPGAGFLDGVACPSATTCEAVGGNVVVTITNGAPNTPQVVPGAGFLDDVACPSATTCEAVGETDSLTAPTGTQGVVAPITNGTPGSAQVVPGTAFLGGVACPSATCEASGANASLQEGVVVYQGIVVPITNGTPGTAQVVPIIGGVACPSASTCEIVAGNIVVPITNGTPGIPQMVSGVESIELGALACPIPTKCVAVGINASGQGVGVVVIVLRASSAHVPLSVSLCQHGGWQNLTNAQGQPFGNQGQCISYFTHNPVSLADLAGSFSGTTIPPFPSHYCSLLPSVLQSFYATYPGSAAVGAVTLGVEGCDIEGGYYIGTFSIATNVGTLSGNVSGSITSGFELTLTVVLGTGAFATTTGTIHVSIQVLPGGSFRAEPMTGSVTVP